jgi:hypothetical protein
MKEHQKKPAEGNAMYLWPNIENSYHLTHEKKREKIWTRKIEKQMGTRNGIQAHFTMLCV